MNSIEFLISDNLISNSCSERFDFIRHSSLYLYNSWIIKSGAKNSALIKEKIYDAVDFGFIRENRILLSNTIFILVTSLGVFFYFPEKVYSIILLFFLLRVEIIIS